MENAKELQIQLQETNEMSPAKRESANAKRIHEQMNPLGNAMCQTDDTLLVMLLYLRYTTL